MCRNAACPGCGGTHDPWGSLGSRRACVAGAAGLSWFSRFAGWTLFAYFTLRPRCALGPLGSMHAAHALRATRTDWSDLALRTLRARDECRNVTVSREEGQSVSHARNAEYPLVRHCDVGTVDRALGLAVGDGRVKVDRGPINVVPGSGGKINVIKRHDRAPHPWTRWR